VVDEPAAGEGVGAGKSREGANSVDPSLVFGSYQENRRGRFFVGSCSFNSETTLALPLADSIVPVLQ
jgi:hypothetical protein